MGPGLALVAVIALLGFWLFGRPPAGRGDLAFSTLAGIDFSGVSEAQRVQIMQTANRERCTCGCGMTLAECINTDRTCPVRRRNMARARRLVAKAKEG